MIYSFYDPGLASRKGLGTFIILDHVLRARAAQLPYVYLGYWIDGCDRMRYKVRFQPAERLTAAGWRPVETTDNCGGHSGFKYVQRGIYAFSSHRDRKLTPLNTSH